MKEMIAIFLVAVMLFGITACASGTGTTTQATSPSNQIGPSASTTPETQPTPTQPPAPAEVTVYLDANGGTPETQSVLLTVGSTYGVLPEPEMEGYLFLGWFTEDGYAITENSLVELDQNHTLYAQWERRTRFTVYLDPNGGRISPYHDQMQVTVGEAYSTMPEPIREGYTFSGWYTDPEKGTKIKETTEFTQEQDLMLYAHWTYDPLGYWRYVLDSRVHSIPLCRRFVVYLEKNAGYKTYIHCPFLDDAGAINPSESLAEEKVTDEWIRETDPYIIVKLTTDIDMGLVNKIAMQRRFDDKEIYIFPTSAISGSEKLQTYYRLQLAKILYPEYFEDVDLKTVASELKINPRIYY